MINMGTCKYFNWTQYYLLLITEITLWYVILKEKNYIEMLLNNAKLLLLLCMIDKNLQGKFLYILHAFLKVQVAFYSFKNSRCMLYFHLRCLHFETCLSLTFPSGWSCHMVTHVLNCVVYLIF